MDFKSWLYKRAVAYIGKCNKRLEGEDVSFHLKNLRRLTYRYYDGKAYLSYGADAEWQNFSRHEVLDYAIQKLAMYEDRKEFEKEQIQTMIYIWNSFPDGDKPEWLTMEQIKEFAQKMGVGYLKGDKYE